jgi:hypothetical protein
LAMYDSPQYQPGASFPLTWRKPIVLTANPIYPDRR